MNNSLVKLYLLGIKTGLTLATILNVNVALSQVAIGDSIVIQDRNEKDNLMINGQYMNDDAIVQVSLEQIQQLLSFNNLSYQATDLLPEGNKTGFISPTDISFDNSAKIAQNTAERSNSTTTSQWTVQAEALFLNRTIPKGILTTQLYDQRTLETGEDLRTDDADFGYEIGTRISVGYTPNQKDTFSFSFFGLQSYSSSATLRAPTPGLPNPVFIQIPLDNTPIFPPFDSFGDRLNLLNQPPPDGLGNDTFAISQAFLLSYQSQIDYSANLYNFEVNYQRKLAEPNNFQPSLLFGLRYISAPEKFNLATFGAAAFPEQNLAAYPRGDYNVETRNNLFGLQIGGNANIGVSRNFSVGLQLKAGVFANSAHQTSTISAFDFDTGELLERIKGDQGGWGISPVLEGNLAANWQVSQNISLTAGFNLVYLYGLALAPRQLRDFAETGEFGSLDLNGDTFYYGPSVGIKVVF